MARKLYNDKLNGLHMTVDNIGELDEAIRSLIRNEVLVGVPDETTERDDAESKAAGLTNASLAYIHDNGAPEANIPARPFMIPGMTEAVGEVTQILTKAAEYALQSKPGKVAEGFQRIGTIAVQKITDHIRAGIPPPLADATLRARDRRTKKGSESAQKEIERRAAGLPPSTEFAIPLIDTQEMLKSITWVIRPRTARGR